VVSESTIDLAVPTHLVEAMTVLPHVSRLDADRLSRSLDADLELSRHLERWIKSKIEEGRIIGERFKQYEEPLYVALWESGEQRIKSDRLNDYLPERYSNATLKARLESLQEKKLVELKEDKAEWKFSPLMTETIRIIKDEFKGNPIAALDLRSYFVGGSIETLRQYLRIMTRIGVLHEVHIASHLAYKVPDTKAVLQRAQEQLGAWQQKLQQSTKYPAGLKAEIDRKTDLAKRSLETASIAYEKQDAISAASSCHRAIKLLADLDAAVHAIEDNVLKIEREYQRLRTRAEDISKKLGSVEGQDLSTWQRDLDNIIQNAKNAYEGDFKVRGRQEQTERAFVSANEQLNEVEEFLDGTVEMSRKLAGSIEQTQKLVSQIRSMSSRYQIQSSAEALQTIEDLFKEARLSYNNQDFTKAEFLLLKILQNELIRDMLQRVNLELADIEGNAKVVTDSAVSIGRITGGNFTEGIQDIRLHIAQARERMTSNELSESVRNLDDARAKISSEQNVLNQAISRWAEKVIPSNLPMGANEIAKNNSMSFELVVDALHLLLRNETIAVVRRG
jgi:predicted  nucleic acid-binding Zn-ribbon protein